MAMLGVTSIRGARLDIRSTRRVAPTRGVPVMASAENKDRGRKLAVTLLGCTMALPSNAGEMYQLAGFSEALETKASALRNLGSSEGKPPMTAEIPAPQAPSAQPPPATTEDIEVSSEEKTPRIVPLGQALEAAKTSMVNSLQMNTIEKVEEEGLAKTVAVELKVPEAAPILAAPKLEAKVVDEKKIVEVKVPEAAPILAAPKFEMRIIGNGESNNSSAAPIQEPPEAAAQSIMKSTAASEEKASSVVPFGQALEAAKMNMINSMQVVKTMTDVKVIVAVEQEPPSAAPVQAEKLAPVPAEKLAAKVVDEKKIDDTSVPTRAEVVLKQVTGGQVVVNANSVRLIEIEGASLQCFDTVPSADGKVPGTGSTMVCETPPPPPPPPLVVNKEVPQPNTLLLAGIGFGAVVALAATMVGDTLSEEDEAEFAEMSVELEAVNRRLAEQKANLQSLVAKTERMSAKFAASGEVQK